MSQNVAECHTVSVGVTWDIDRLAGQRPLKRTKSIALIVLTCDIEQMHMITIEPSPPLS
jgi:hypothetical protein